MEEVLENYLQAEWHLLLAIFELSMQLSLIQRGQGELMYK